MLPFPGIGLLRRPMPGEFVLCLQASPANTAQTLPVVSAVGAKSTEQEQALGNYHYSY